MNDFGKVKAWLSGTRHITVPDDWLEACLEWLKEEHQEAPLSSQQLMGMVYDQWLAADLRELQTSCLPASITQDNKTFLQGFFCLQVDSLLDVSQPYYSQLQKVTGTENANVHVTATQVTQPAIEMKAGRMLMLKMTDGTVDIQGMEYHPIPALRLHLQPGCKVCINGCVLCRHGVMFLKSENIEILGGEVDSLLETNTQDKLLQSALAGCEQTTRQVYRQEFQNTEVTRKSNPVANTSTKSNRPAQPGSSLGTSLTRGHKQPMYRQKTNTFSGRLEDRGRHQSNMGDFEMDDDDDFLESLATTELAAVEEEWDTEMEDMVVSGINQTGHTNTISTVRSPSMSTGRHTSTGPPSQNVNSGWMNSSQSSITGSKLSSQKPQTAVIAGQPCCQPMAAVRPQTVPSDGQRVSQISRNNTCNRPAQLGTGNSTLNSGQGHSRPNEGTHIADNTDMDNLAELMYDDFPMDDDDFPMDDDFAESSFSFLPLSKRLKPSETLTGVKSTSLNIQSGSSSGQTTMVTVQHDQSEVCVKITTNDKPRSSNSVSTSGINGRLQQPRLPTASASVANIACSKNQSSSSTGGYKRLSQCMHPEDLINHIRRTTQPGQLREIEVSEDEPYTYLSSVEPLIQANKHRVFRVKAYVSTLLSKLDNDQGRAWNLSCRLNDGSSTMDVHFTDQVLTELIGFPAHESFALREGARGDKLTLEHLSEGIKECQLRLINLSSLFEVEYRPSCRRPCVVRIIPITDIDIEKLYTRVSKKLCH